MSYHKPVLLHETVGGLEVKPEGVYVDVTFGGGGHSKAILEGLGPVGRLFAFDQDQDALANAFEDSRFVLIPENFRYLKQFLRFHGVKKVDGILADFGVSSHQFDVAERGFSTRFDADLDMRMNQSNSLSAFHVVNDYSEDQIRSVLFQYGELRQAPAMARTLVEFREKEPIRTSNQLKEVLKRYLLPKRENKILAQVYQAIRIEVNQEIEVLKELLEQSVQLLDTGGRLSVISYHSFEDRLVKRFIRNGLFEGEPERDMFGNFEVPFKKVGKLIVPGAEELKVNNRARSAKLRIAERLEMKKNVYSILRGKFLISDDSFKNWRVILFISALAIVMIASAHSADQKVYEIAQMTEDVKELRSAFVDRRRKLMRLKMESTIIDKVKDKGVVISETPPKKIKIKSQNN